MREKNSIILGYSGIGKTYHPCDRQKYCSHGNINDIFGKPGKGIKAYIGGADKNKSKRKRLIPLFKQLFKRS